MALSHRSKGETMDEKTRRFIEQAEWHRMRANEDRVRFKAGQEADAQRAHDKRVAYVVKYGRDGAVARTIKKWAVGFFAVAVLSFPDMLKDEGAVHAFSMAIFLPLLGFGIGCYRASRLPRM